MNDPLFGEQYHDNFDSQLYLKTRYGSPSQSLFRTFPLPHLYSFYQSFGSKDLKILEVGAGPSIAYVISAAPFASEIVLSEYTEDNRREIQQWLDKSADAHNWKPFLEYVVADVEGGEAKDVAVREEKLRSSIKAVISCDVTKDIPLPVEYMKQYDVVHSILCLESACETRDDYVPTLKRLACLLKPNGKIVLYHVERGDLSVPAQYPVGEYCFKNIRLSQEFITESLTAAGFSKIARVSTQLPPELQPSLEDPAVPALYTATYSS